MALWDRPMWQMTAYGISSGLVKEAPVPVLVRPFPRALTLTVVPRPNPPCAAPPSRSICPRIVRGRFGLTRDAYQTPGSICGRAVITKADGSD